MSKITITTAARASTVSPSSTSALIVNDLVPTWPIHERTAYGSRR